MNKIQKEILSLLELKDGWHFGEGVAISEEAAVIAMAIADSLPSIYDFIEAYPLDNGYISLRVGLDKKNVLGLMIEPDEQVHVYYDNTKNIEDCGIVQLSNIKKFVIEKVQSLKKAAQCISLDYYTQNTFRELSIPLLLNHLGLETIYRVKAPMKKAYPLSMKTVQSAQTIQYASISRIEKKSSNTQQAYLTYTGCSQNSRYYHKKQTA